MAEQTTPIAPIMQTIVPIVPSPISPSKSVETYLGEYVLRLLYAACVDVELELDASDRFSPYVNHSYTSICVAKKDRMKLTARFTVTDDMKQMLAFLFDKIVEECLSVTIEAGDNADLLESKISENTDDSFFTFALEFARAYTIGKTLTSACDPGCGLRGFVVGRMPAYVSKDSVLSLVFTTIDNFLKATAIALIRLWWFLHKAIDGGMLSGLYYTRGLNQYMVADLAGCLREKPAAKPRAKKPSGETDTASEIKVTPETNENIVANIEETDVATVEGPIIDLGALEAVLGAV